MQKITRHIIKCQVHSFNRHIGMSFFLLHENIIYSTNDGQTVLIILWWACQWSSLWVHRWMRLVQTSLPSPAKSKTCCKAPSSHQRSDNCIWRVYVCVCVGCWVSSRQSRSPRIGTPIFRLGSKQDSVCLHTLHSVSRRDADSIVFTFLWLVWMTLSHSHGKHKHDVCFEC